MAGPVVAARLATMTVRAEIGAPTWPRRAAGFAAAGAMSLYLLVKVVWIALEVLHGTADWVLLNAVTVVMAVAGIGLGLALAQPWGMRLPAWLVVPVVWISGGFLVSMLPYLLVSSLLPAGTPEPAGEPGLPAWETVFIGAGFLGMALALVVGLPLYLRDRWPWAFAGRAGAGARTRWIMVPPAALAVLWTYWAAGGTAGLDPSAPPGAGADARLLLANSALCAMCGVWSLWALGGGRGGGARTPSWPPMALGFVASGSLFAWGAWKLLWLLPPGLYQPAEYRWLALSEHVVAVGAGLAMVVTLVRSTRPPSGDRPADRHRQNRGPRHHAGGGTA
ncbi:hypothetical protein GCM10009733_065650 [Nonomuraea maheshkhaliensis]|uniref:DUF998 domain-containing protein n=2 Tax=Nonomuraea maheshkhaliensis TaxID=419590 RepID=A0ABN2FT05_9ACTN